MRRTASDPRPDWHQRVAAQGLVFAETALPGGGTAPYWDESACYRLTSAEVDYLEAVTEQLHEMSVEAASFLCSGAMGDLGLPPGALELARASLAANPPSLYGRFDFAWDGQGHAKLLEYNADTPTGLLEASVVQWYWLEDTHPELDQWNSLHERLIQAWQEMRWRIAQAPVYFARHVDDPSAEEWLTVTYLQDTAEQAGLRTRAITMGEIGYDHARTCFVGTAPSDRNQPDVLRTCFKLYPWEDMLAEDFGRYVDPTSTSLNATTWIEPPWKVLLSNKALLAALWHLFPQHECLLPAYLNDPGPLTEWVAKPFHGREGANIRIHAAGIETSQPGGYGAEGFCYQQWNPLPSFDGNHPVLGSWIVDGKAAGLGIRESDGLVTDDVARFVPHVIEAPRPDAATQVAWLAEPPAVPAAPVRGEPTSLPGAGVIPARIEPWRPFRVEPDAPQDAAPGGGRPSTYDPLAAPSSEDPLAPPNHERDDRTDPTRGTI